MAINVTVADADDTLPTNPAINRSVQDYVVPTPRPRPAVESARPIVEEGVINPPWVMFANGLDIKGPKYNSFIRSGLRLMQATQEGWPYKVTMVAGEDKYIYVVFNTDTGKFDDNLVKADTIAPATNPRHKYYVLGRAIADADGVVTWYQQATSNIWDSYQTSFLAETTAETAGVYSWKRLEDDGVTDESPAITGTKARELNGMRGIPDGSVVRLWPYNGSTGAEHMFTAPDILYRPDLFPVALSSASGSAGNATTQCAFTYTVKDLNAVTLLTGASPVYARPAKGKMVAAANGMAYTNATGTVILYSCDEVPDVEVC